MTFRHFIHQSINSTFPLRHNLQSNHNFKFKSPNFYTLKKTDFKGHKYSIYPTKEQQNILKDFFRASKYIYNSALKFIKEQFKLGIKYIDINKNNFLEEKFLHNDNYKNKEHLKWLVNIPYDIRANALIDLQNNFKTNMILHNYNQKKFNVKFRTNNSQSMKVLKKHWGLKKCYSSRFDQVFRHDVLNCDKKLPQKLDHDSRLKRDFSGRYFLCIPYIIKEQIMDNDKKDIIALDPGIRTFLTGFSITNKDNILTSGIYKKNINKSKICYLLNKRGQLQSKRDKYKKKIKDKDNKENVNIPYKKALLRVNEKIRNIVKDIHKKTAKDLCEKYKHIIIPKLDFHSFKNLNKKSKNMLIALSHCSFVDLLKTKAREYNTIVSEIEEHNTSKTCTRCNLMNEELGSSKTFNCKKCKLKINRDVNGARNILLKGLSELKIIKT